MVEMSRRTTPPFRADHVGSLLRPPELTAAREQLAAGAIDAAGLEAVEDQAIRDLIAMQADVGLQSATDGEFRRRSWHMDFITRLDGVTAGPPVDDGFWRNESGAVGAVSPSIAFGGRLALAEPIFAGDFAFLRDNVGDATTAKLTIPSPNMVHFRAAPTAIADSDYASEEDLWADLIAAYRAEVGALGDLGCTYLQFDDTSLAYLNDPRQRARIAEQGQDADHQHQHYIQRLNEVIADRPEGMAVTTHLCRGNFRSSWFAEGSYDFVAEALFNELAVDGFFLEYDDERSGGFEPLRFVPKGKVVVLGLITTKRGDLEDADGLERRIEDASRFIDVEQLCISPQCGFASDAAGNALSHEQQVAKLRLAVDVAKEVWG
jgi:5-methyltetrahydropteroyltriglutamate--homocysteine methyltransferase